MKILENGFFLSIVGVTISFAISVIQDSVILWLYLETDVILWLYLVYTLCFIIYTVYGIKLSWSLYRKWGWDLLGIIFFFVPFGIWLSYVGNLEIKYTKKRIEDGFVAIKIESEKNKVFLKDGEELVTSNNQEKVIWPAGGTSKEPSSEIGDTDSRDNSNTIQATKLTRKCPLCAEEIKAEAIICRFCQRDLPSSDGV